jgi:ABC-type sugar transport system permease subunit
MPYVLSEINVAIMWMLLYNPDPERGLLNAIVLGLGGEPIGWLSDTRLALVSIFIALTWKYFGFHMLLYLAGLQNIPVEIEEAARIDGANSFQNFFYIPASVGRHDSHICLLICSWLDSTIHTGLDHDQGWTRQRKRDPGHIHVSLRLCTFPIGLWFCRCDLYVLSLPDLFSDLSAPYAPTRLPDRTLKGAFMEASRPIPRSASLQKFLTRLFQYLILLIVVVIMFVPLVILGFGSLKTTGEMYSHPYTIPNPPHWENLVGIISTPTFWRLLLNSVIVMLATTAGVVFVCSLAAFVFARLEFRSKGWFFNLFTLGLMFPISVAILPVYFVLRQIMR